MHSQTIQLSLNVGIVDAFKGDVKHFAVLLKHAGDDKAGISCVHIRYDTPRCYNGYVLYWECKRRLSELEEFRRLVVEYFTSIGYGPGARRGYQTEESHEARNKINLMLHRVGDSCIRVGQPMIVSYFPAPAIGGFQGNLNLLLELFNLRDYQIPNSRITDSLDRTIGTYQRRTRWLCWQMFNPFFWLYWVIEKVMGVPFRILGAAGFDSAKLENSFAGKLFKAIGGFAGFIAAFLTTLQLLGWLQPALKWSHLLRPR